MSAPTSSSRLVCPGCAASYPSEERFCPDCRIPLIHDPRVVSLDDVGERHRRARKVKPQLAEGPLVYATGARNQAEGEFIQALLLEEGVPSLLRRSAGFDVPDFLAAGPRDVLVPQAAHSTAREVLLQAELIDGQEHARVVSPAALLLGLLSALAVGALLVWLATLALH